MVNINNELTLKIPLFCKFTLVIKQIKLCEKKVLLRQIYFQAFLQMLSILVGLNCKRQEGKTFIINLKS